MPGKNRSIILHPFPLKHRNALKAVALVCPLAPGSSAPKNDAQLTFGFQFLSFTVIHLINKYQPFFHKLKKTSNKQTHPVFFGFIKQKILQGLLLLNFGGVFSKQKCLKKGIQSNGILATSPLGGTSETWSSAPAPAPRRQS